MTSRLPRRPAAAPPTATYRLQLQPGFGFAAAEAALPRIAALGVSHLHLSPVLEAVPGSTHGYDVVDHSRVREELGGERGLRRLSARAREHGLGLVLDIVPNHMAAAPRHNRQWWQVLREGPASPRARWFDIDWDAQGGKVLLPLLGAPLGQELPHLRVEGGELRYHDHVLPLREGTEGLPLPELLAAQHYRLGWWRLARTELNYRRFFTISDLIAVRVEDPEVFAATHAKILRLLADGVADGLRVDHPDGLADPAAYLERLHAAGGGCWTVVEKILADGERLPADWQAAGTTGYDALRHLDGVLTDPGGAAELLAHYRHYAAPPAELGGDFEATAAHAARRVVTHDLAAEVERLTRECQALCAEDPAAPDHAPWALRTALRELLVRLRVYRPYPRQDAALVLTEDAATEARAAFRVPEEARAVDTVRALVLGGRCPGPRRDAFSARFAQTASALRAKSLEDAAFYRYVPLLSANEVGGEPGTPALAPEAFHAFCARLQSDRPLGGTVLTTHDTKRSADVRAAVAVLTQCPGRWAELLGELTAGTARHGGAPAPDHQVAWAVWQSALGLGVPDVDRLGAAALKHVREAGLRTTWTEPDPAYEAAVSRFVAEGPGGPAWKAVAEFDAALRPYVATHILCAALLHLTMPGVPDLYQGTEEEYRALVDPDNRRPLTETGGGDGNGNGNGSSGRDGDGDGDRRRGAREDTAAGTAVSGTAGADDLSARKRALTTAALRLRRARPEVFGADATYAPLHAEGPAAGHCLAFTRSDAVLTAVTRLPLRLAEAGGWRGTRLALPAGRWRDVLAGGEWEGRVTVVELFGERGFALLERDARAQP